MTTQQVHLRGTMPSIGPPQMGHAMNQPTIGAGYNNLAPNGKPRSLVQCDNPVFPHCDGYVCDLPRIPCNHATPSLNLWKGMDYARFIVSTLAANVCYMFVLMYLMIEYNPLLGGFPLFFFAVVRGASMFGIGLMYTADQGGYVNPLISLAVYFAWLVSYKKDPADADQPAGWEFLKGLLVLVLQFAGAFLGLFFVWLIFVGPGPYVGFNYGSTTFVTGLAFPAFSGPGAPATLSTWQGVAREFIATLSVISTVLYAHSNSNIRKHQVFSARLIACSYTVVSFLFGQTTGAIINPFYWIVVRLMNISAGDGLGLTIDGFLVYFVGPVSAMAVAVLLFIARYYYLKRMCSPNVCAIANKQA